MKNSDWCRPHCILVLFTFEIECCKTLLAFQFTSPKTSQRSIRINDVSRLALNFQWTPSFDSNYLSNSASLPVHKMFTKKQGSDCELVQQCAVKLVSCLVLQLSSNGLANECGNCNNGQLSADSAGVQPDRYNVLVNISSLHYMKREWRSMNMIMNSFQIIKHYLKKFV